MDCAEDVLAAVARVVVRDDQLSVLGRAQTEVVEVAAGVAIGQRSQSLLSLQNKVGHQCRILHSRHLDGVIRVGLNRDAIEVDHNVANHPWHLHELV